MPKIEIMINRENLVLTIQGFLKGDDDAWLFKLHAESRKVLEELKTQLSYWKGISLSQEEIKRVLSDISKINPDFGSQSQAAIQTLKKSFRIYPEVENYLYLEDTTPKKRLYLQYQCSRIVDILFSDSRDVESHEELSEMISKTFSSLLSKDREMILAREMWSWDFYNSLKHYIQTGEMLYKARELKNINIPKSDLKSFMGLYEICSLVHTSFCEFQILDSSFQKSGYVYPFKEQAKFEHVIEFIEKIEGKNTENIKSIQYLDVFRIYKEEGLLEALLLLLFRPDITSEQCGEILKNLQYKIYNSKDFELDKGLRGQVEKYFDSTSKWSWNKVRKPDPVSGTYKDWIELMLRASNDLTIILRCPLNCHKKRILLLLYSGDYNSEISEVGSNLKIVCPKLASFGAVMSDILRMIFCAPYMQRVDRDYRGTIFAAYRENFVSDRNIPNSYFLLTIKQLRFLNLFLLPSLPPALVAMQYYNNYFQKTLWNCAHSPNARFIEYFEGKNDVHHNHIDLVQYFAQQNATEYMIDLWQTDCFDDGERKEIFIFLEKEALNKQEVKKLYDKLRDLNQKYFEGGSLSFEKHFLENSFLWLSENQNDGLAFLLTREINKDKEILFPRIKKNPFIFKYVVHNSDFLSKEIILVLLFQLKKEPAYLEKIKELKSQKTEKQSERIKCLQTLLCEFISWGEFTRQELSRWEDAFFIDILAEFDDFGNLVEKSFCFFKECSNRGENIVYFHFDDNPQNQDSLRPK